MLSRTVKVFGLLTLLAALALPPAAVARTHHSRARAIHLTAREKRIIRARLMREIKANPRMIRNKAWLRSAAIVQFQLPVTIRLNPQPFTAQGVTNVMDNNATLDLGPSLGSRQIGLTGALHATISFISTFDAGQPGNVNISIGPQTSANTCAGQPCGITTTSVPLLTNPNVTANPPSPDSTVDGCTTAGIGAALSDLAGTQDDPAALSNSSATIPTPYGTAVASDQPDPSTMDNLGNNAEVNGYNDPNAGDVVLRTGDLSLGIPAPGPYTDPTGYSPVNGETISPSGGLGNLFGLPVRGSSYPGTGTSVDVKVALATAINAIVRQVDYGQYFLYDTNQNGVGPLTSGNGFPGNRAYADCRQAWTGAIENILTTELTGSLHISPALTFDSRLRIATVALSSQPTQETVAACLVPTKLFTAGGSTGADISAAPNSTVSSPGTYGCNDAASPFATPGSTTYNGLGNPLNPIGGGLTAPLVDSSAYPLPAFGSNPQYEGNGAAVILPASLTVNNLRAEVLLGN